MGNTFPTRLSMGISNPRSRLSMPIGSSYRLFGVTFSDGSRAPRWTLSMGPLTAAGEITEFHFEGSQLNERKRVPWGRLRGRALDTHRRFVQNRVKTRFEHMYLRLRNFHWGVDLNIPTPLTMQRRIVSTRKMHFDDDHHFSLSILNSVFTRYNKSVRFSVCGISLGFLHFLFQPLELYLIELWCAFEEKLALLSKKVQEHSWISETRVRQCLVIDISKLGKFPIAKPQDCEGSQSSHRE